MMSVFIEQEQIAKLRLLQLVSPLTTQGAVFEGEGDIGRVEYVKNKGKPKLENL